MSSKHGRKPSQVADKAKKGMKGQAQRMESDMDQMADDARRDMDRLGAGIKREAQQARSDAQGLDKEMKRKLQHR
ncbi:hypothetical protein ACFYTS_30940 [Nocardia sp. NPDC004151]|uniref:hypothetical protein n=1 Tax=Nocardia sp. NPDC004151 TaxID=3364304 RepID=UPI0036B97D76